MSTPETTHHGKAASVDSPEGNGDVFQVAMEWQVTLWSGELTHQERRAFDVWLNAATDHQQAWQQLQRIQEPFEQVPDDVAGKVLRAIDPDIQRRKLLFGFAALASIGATGYGIGKTPQWQAATADYSTRRGETRNIALPDGSELTLNTDSAVDVTFSQNRRTLYLRRGEVMIATAPDPATIPRPFLVSTRSGQVRPIGTRFLVRQHNDDANNVFVQVLEGAIELTPLSGTVMRVDANQQARFNQHQVSRPTPVHSANTAWTQGLLIAEQERLEDFLTELGRYRSGVLRCDAAVANLIISGVYPLRDTDQILQALKEALPIRIHTLTRYWITVLPA